MRRALGITLVTLALMVPLGCSDHHSVTQPAEQGFFGTWEWVTSVGGYTGHDVRTPASEGYTIRFTLERDGHYQVFRNGALVLSDVFTIHREEQPVSPGYVDIIHYSGMARGEFGCLYPVQAISLVTPDSLSLADMAADLYRHRCARRE